MLTIFLTPFDVDVESMPPSIQMELIDLQSSIELKSVFKTHKYEFYQKYIFEDKFPKLRRLEMCITAAFGTTYNCESFFFQAKYNEIEEQKQADR